MFEGVLFFLRFVVINKFESNNLNCLINIAERDIKSNIKVRQKERPILFN